MSASTAIGMVSASLRNLLVGEMKLTPVVPVTVLAPDEKGDARRVNLFLYKITENAFLKNQDWALQPGDSSRIVDAPLSLNLFYLLTPYAQNHPVTGNSTGQEILGEVMRVFYENPTVPPAHLDPGLLDRPRAAADRQSRAGPGGAEPAVEHVLPAVPAVRCLPGLYRPAGPAGGAQPPDAAART